MISVLPSMELDFNIISEMCKKSVIHTGLCKKSAFNYTDKFAKGKFSCIFFIKLNYSMLCKICTNLLIKYRAAQKNWSAFTAIGGYWWNLAFKCQKKCFKKFFKSIPETLENVSYSMLDALFFSCYKLYLNRFIIFFNVRHYQI